MVLDKKISLGTVITICTVVGTFIYTQGMLTSKIEVFEEKDKEHSMKVNKNVDKIQKLEVSVGKLETQIDEGFKRLESLIMEM